MCKNTIFKSTRISKSSPWLAVVAMCLLAGNLFAAIDLQPPIVFATSNSARIEIPILSGQPMAGVEIAGKIVTPGSTGRLWSGPLGKIDLSSNVTGVVTQTVSGLKPELWNPASPKLYYLVVTASVAGQPVATNFTRFGFRTFENKGGQFWLNGRPIFLRGMAINPPGRTIPPKTGESREFAEAYVRCMKEHHFNAIRLDHASQIWFDVCDEQGMMLFQGNYGSPFEGEAMKKGAPTNFDKSLATYETFFSSFASHPSVVIYVLANELPTSGERGAAYSAFLTRACAALKQWDPTRLYIGNAGYGEGREGDVCDVHRYWGWYYNTFLTFYNLREEKMFGDPKKVQSQPLTFSECVGNFTGPNGEYNIIIRKQLGAQLNWTGHSADQLDDTVHYQCEEIREVTESFRRLRQFNRHIAGVMPFTIAFANWSGITNFSQMKPTPALAQFAVSYQPVLLSWENWQAQVYAGKTIDPFLHVVNDADDGLALTDAVLEYQLRGPTGKVVQRSQIKLPSIPYYRTWDQQISLTLPANSPTGDYILSGKIISGGQQISHNDSQLFVSQPDDAGGNPTNNLVWLFDLKGRTAKALTTLGIAFKSLTSLAELPADATVLLIGEEAWGQRPPVDGAKLKEFIANGGRVLCLRQNPTNFDGTWLPEAVTFFTASVNDATYPVRSRPFSDNMNINLERPTHPVFAGLNRQRLELWSDYTSWDETEPGFPRVYPVTSGFKLKSDESLARTAILADYDRALEGVALCEMFSGKGSVMLSAFDCVNRAGLDPASDRLLKNLIRFVQSSTGHDAHPLIDGPVKWGNYASERGLVTGPGNGLLINADWVQPPTNPSAKPLTQEEGEWNKRPSDQFVPTGRNPFGPYTYSASSSLHGLASGETNGTGFFWARIPVRAKVMITTVKNPTDAAGQLAVSFNQSPDVAPTKIPAHQIIKISTPLADKDRDIAVRLSGTRTLILQETDFQ